MAKISTSSQPQIVKLGSTPTQGSLSGPGRIVRRSAGGLTFDQASQQGGHQQSAPPTPGDPLARITPSGGIIQRGGLRPSTLQ